MRLLALLLVPLVAGAAAYAHRSARLRSAWLLTAADCSCTTLDGCALFAPDAAASVSAADPEPLRITHVASSS